MRSRRTPADADPPSTLVPPALEVARYRVGAGEYAVVSFELSRAARVRLTAAERAVVDALLEGLTTREIATRRRAALRTIANQLASVYRKLGVRSRVELALLADVIGLDGAPPRRAR